MPDKFVFLAMGDIVGRPGRKALKRHLLSLCQKYSPSLIIANGENAAGGVGMTEKVGRELFAQVDVLTSGNHIWDKKEAIPYLEDEPRLLRPANYPSPNPGKGTYIYKDMNGIEVGILNLQGRVFMEPLDCPFRVAEREIKKIREITPIIIVDFHAEATSEKQAMGWFLDGKVTALIGTHTHVVTADERILPKGTAYITDIGMIGGLNSVIGIRRDQGVQRFLTARPQRFEPEKEGMIFAALIVEADVKTGKSISIRKEIFIEEGLGSQQQD